MTERSLKRGFAARPGDPEAWVRAPELPTGRTPNIERVLQAVDAVEQLGVDPVDACPDHWRQLHNRLASGEPPRAYTADRHRAWLLRRRIDP